MEMGVQFIANAPWKDKRCNAAQLENGYIVTARQLKPGKEVMMDWHVIADHNGNMVYEKKKSITPKPYISMKGPKVKD